MRTCLQEQTLVRIPAVLRELVTAQQHEARASERLLDQQVDRERVLEAPERDQSQVELATRRGRRECRQVAVAEGEDDEVSRRQGEIDGVFAVVESHLAGREKMHRISRRAPPRLRRDRSP